VPEISKSCYVPVKRGCTDFRALGELDWANPRSRRRGNRVSLRARANGSLIECRTSRSGPNASRFTRTAARRAGVGCQSLLLGKSKIWIPVPLAPPPQRKTRLLSGEAAFTKDSPKDEVAGRRRGGCGCGPRKQVVDNRPATDLRTIRRTKDSAAKLRKRAAVIGSSSRHGAPAPRGRRLRNGVSYGGERKTSHPALSVF
jgi:hypothetical protein